MDVEDLARDQGAAQVGAPEAFQKVHFLFRALFEPECLLDVCDLAVNVHLSSRETLQGLSGVVVAAVLAKPVRRRGEEENHGQDKEGKDPLEGKWDLIRPLAVDRAGAFQYA